MKNRVLTTLPLLCGIILGRPAIAHPMGNFSINHFAHIEAGQSALRLRYVIDYAEIPTVAERNSMDADGNGALSPAEQTAYLKLRSQSLAARLTVTLDGTPVPLKIAASDMAFRPGAGGLQTLRLALTLTGAFLPRPAASNPHLSYRDDNYPERAGWKEVVATSASGAELLNATVSTTDRSHELTSYPVDTSVIPPQQTEATLVIAPAGSGRPMATPATLNPTPPATPARNASTPQDGFTQAIATRQLTGPVILISLALAFLFGALHALSPGHGKAMVAAYLVGSRGTAKHAVFLGGVVTLTHTVGVFAMGLVTLAAAQYIVPERLYPFLSGLSGLAIVAIGLTLLRQRLRLARAISNEAEEETDADSDLYAEFEPPPLPDRGPISFKTLLALGITGGALPCPSALVVMLSAVALHRVAFGLVMILAFSLGLAAVLTGIGLAIVHARGLFERLPRHTRLFARLPVFSAVVVTGVGLVLLVRALHGSF